MGKNTINHAFNKKMSLEILKNDGKHPPTSMLVYYNIFYRKDHFLITTVLYVDCVRKGVYSIEAGYALLCNDTRVSLEWVGY